MNTGTCVLEQADRDQLTALVDQLGEQTVRERLGLSRLAFARALAGLSVRAGTVALVRAGLPHFDAHTTSGSHR